MVWYMLSNLWNTVSRWSGMHCKTSCRDNKISSFCCLWQVLKEFVVRIQSVLTFQEINKGKNHKNKIFHWKIAKFNPSLIAKSHTTVAKRKVFGSSICYLLYGIHLEDKDRTGVVDAWYTHTHKTTSIFYFCISMYMQVTYLGTFKS